MGMAALSSESAPGSHLAKDHMVVEKLSAEVAKFITRLEKGTLTGDISVHIAKIVAAEQHLLSSAHLAFEVAKTQSHMSVVKDEGVIDRVARFRLEVVNLLQISNPQADNFSYDNCKTQLQQVQIAYEDTKKDLLQASADLRAPVPDIIEILEQNSRIRRMARQMNKAIQLLNELYTEIEVLVPEVTGAELARAQATGNTEQKTAV